MNHNVKPIFAAGIALLILAAGGAGAYFFLSPAGPYDAAAHQDPSHAANEVPQPNVGVQLAPYATINGDPFTHGSVSSQGHVVTFHADRAAQLTWTDSDAEPVTLDIFANVSDWSDDTLVALTPGLTPTMHVVTLGDGTVDNHERIPLAGQPKDVLVNPTNRQIWALVSIDDTTHLQSFNLEKTEPTPIVDVPLGRSPVGFFTNHLTTWVPVFGEQATVVRFDNTAQKAPVSTSVDMLPYVATGNDEHTWVAAANMPRVDRLGPDQEVRSFDTPAPLSTLTYQGQGRLLGASNQTGDLFLFDENMAVQRRHDGLGVIVDTVKWLDTTFAVTSGQTPQLIAIRHSDLTIRSAVPLEGQPTAVSVHRLPKLSAYGVSVFLPEAGRVSTWTFDQH